MFCAGCLRRMSPSLGRVGAPLRGGIFKDDVVCRFRNTFTLPARASRPSQGRVSVSEVNPQRVGVRVRSYHSTRRVSVLRRVFPFAFGACLQRMSTPDVYDECHPPKGGYLYRKLTYCGRVSCPKLIQESRKSYYSFTSLKSKLISKLSLLIGLPSTSTYGNTK